MWVTVLFGRGRLIFLLCFAGLAHPFKAWFDGVQMHFRGMLIASLVNLIREGSIVEKHCQRHTWSVYSAAAFWSWMLRGVEAYLIHGVLWLHIVQDARYLFRLTPEQSVHRRSPGCRKITFWAMMKQLSSGVWTLERFPAWSCPARVYMAAMANLMCFLFRIIMSATMALSYVLSLEYRVANLFHSILLVIFRGTQCSDAQIAANFFHSILLACFGLLIRILRFKRHATF